MECSPRLSIRVVLGLEFVFRPWSNICHALSASSDANYARTVSLLND